MIFNEESPIYDIYRNIRANIAFAKDYKNIKSILVTSFQQNEGKTTVASNLAIALANIDKKVLIIDGDLRNPNIHKIFNAKNDVGISGICEEKMEINSYIEKINIKNISILTSGKITNKSSEIIASDFMKDIIQKSKETYDYIIVDSHSLSLASDSSVLSTYCDGTILVTGCGEVNMQDAKQAKEKLTSMGANILGVILNKYE